MTKVVHLHTSDNDGEPAQHNFQIDTATGIVSYWDNVGNSIVLNAPANQLTTNVPTFIVANTTLYEIHAPTIVLDGNVFITQNLYVLDSVLIKNLLSSDVQQANSAIHPCTCPMPSAYSPPPSPPMEFGYKKHGYGSLAKMP
jgi:hypothetical protein